MNRPRILLSTSNEFRDRSLRRYDSLTGRNYSEAVVLAGGLPLMVANVDPRLAEAYVENADAVLFTGGADVDPRRFGQQPHPDLERVDQVRDAFELALYRAARSRGLPILGVCRGIQLINVAEGGTLHQHIPALPGMIQHSQADIAGQPSHTVALEAASRLAKELGRDELVVNSYHHQAVDRLGRGLRATARTSDGLIEAVEADDGSLLLAVQWHPEISFREHPEDLLPFRMLVEAATAEKGIAVGS